ncbi:BREX-5 system phosphatase PglZ [Halorubrum sp. 48-1-W]|uniref:BREX-5 system phosphatase PglZ n=1 Tax=Halorubrum sp. 48-1-W TaxID=2249761 RepID=UPI000DCF26D2|nr:BREX-5 system phosphatase PglZ [Halorubrum sp. 48-1-W]RAW45818.1 BREX-5 system phosphatase PglZ [Halorubrum sp. 48-1-W]
MPATKTIPECTREAIRTAVDDAVDDEPTVLWWDEGGFLEDVVRGQADALGYAFNTAETTPLELRADAPRETTVWYVPQAKTDEVDWFRDVEHTGGEIEAHVGTLAVRCFENDRPQATSLRTTYEDADDRETVAKTLYGELNGKGGLPNLRSVRTKIVLDGHEDPVRFVLEHDADGLPETPDLLKIRDLLVDGGIDAVEDATDPETIVRRTRRCAVAEWLVEAGLDRSTLPAEYRSSSESGVGVSRPELQSVLSRTDRAEALADHYLDPSQRYWHDVLRKHDDPWALSNCPVDASLEHELWDAWLSTYHAGDYESCAVRARRRHDTLENAYGEVPWTTLWEQAIDIAELAGEIDNWGGRSDTSDVVELYGDVDDGTWQIDNAVFNLIISGTPEDDLPEEHPATSSLDDLRSSLTESQYLDYLAELGELVTDQVDSGAPFVGKPHAHQFFSEEQDHLQSGQSVALFVIDALRFDLAHQLANAVRRELPRLDVSEDAWVGTLPSATEFGKAALTPGSKFSFGIGLEGGALVPKRNGLEISYHRRKELLENDGWSYIVEADGDDAGWGNTRVAYYWNDIDSAGEKELTDFEAVFDDRIDSIADIITEKLDHGEWDRAYILADHGFVSLPRTVDIDDIYPPDEAEKVTHRWIAGRNLPDNTPGVRLDERTQLGYLDEDTDVNTLADPIQRFRNQGVPDARFYHGGILPQEFVLNFVTITQG